MMKLDAVIKQLQGRWASLPDRRKPNNNQQYEMADAAMAALSVFFMQSPSFLAHQQALAQRTGQSNAVSLFRLNLIPSLFPVMDRFATCWMGCVLRCLRRILKHCMHV